ncbi:MAG: hypothetical protein AAGF30_02240 [Pseudomonadota bacterium]
MGVLDTAGAFVVVALAYLYIADPCMDLGNLAKQCRVGLAR